MASSVAYEFNSAGHPHFFCMSTYSSVDLTYKTRNRVTLAGYFAHFLKLDLGIFLLISFTAYPALCY